MLRPITYAPAPRISAEHLGVLLVVEPGVQLLDRPVAGFSSVWFGPAAYPSTETAMSQTTLPMEILLVVLTVLSEIDPGWRGKSSGEVRRQIRVWFAPSRFAVVPRAEAVAIYRDGRAPGYRRVWSAS